MPAQRSVLDVERTARRAYFSTSTPSRFNIQRNKDGSGTIKGVNVFRTGTFRDSMGEQRTWSDMHLAEMASHFTMLRDSNLFPDVPVRIDHSWSVDKIMGYFSNLDVNGQFLTADFDITDPNALVKVENGTFRSLSLEVGQFLTNDEEAYYPVCMGVAFVDISAVQGLHTQRRDVSFFSFAHPDPQGDPVSETIAKFRIKGVEVVDYAAVQQHINELEAAAKTYAPPAKFRVNGTETSDAVVTQAHIDGLEKFAKEAREGNRKAFVAKLETDKKIAAPQKAGLEAHALSLTDEQFAHFAATYEHAPALGILQNYGADGQPAPPTGAGGTVDAKADRISVLEQTVAMHRRSGMTPENVAKTRSYIELQTLSASAQ